MIYGKLDFTPGNKPYWTVSGLKPHVAIRFKQIFPGILKSSTGPFRLQDSNTMASDLKWFTDRYPLEITPKEKRILNKKARKHLALIEEAENVLSPNYKATDRIGLQFGQTLREYQKQAVDFIELVRSGLIIDDVGLGKTYEGLGVSLLPGALPMVVVCEPHLQKQWEEKANTFVNLNVYAPQGNKPYKLPSADIFIFKYSQLSPLIDVLNDGWVKSIAFDEIQNLRTGTAANKGVAAKAICQNIDIKIGLTATLIYNYGIEAWNIIDIIRLGLLGTKDEFMREWCAGKGIVQDPDALGEFLRESNMIIRRTKADVGQEAKQKRPHLEWVPYSDSEVRDAEVLAEELAMKTLSGTFNESGLAARQLDMKMREMTGIAKATHVAAYVRMLVETGAPLILFGWHHEVYRIWESELRDLNPLFYTGKQTISQKEKIKQAFINGESDILIMSLRSGAGTDGLQFRASTVVFGELDWSPKVHEQCIGRLDRDGQENEVFTFYIATDYGSDPSIIDILGLKESQSRGILDPGTNPIIHDADINRIKQLARDYLKSRGINCPENQDKVLETKTIAALI